MKKSRHIATLLGCASFAPMILAASNPAPAANDKTVTDPKPAMAPATPSGGAPAPAKSGASRDFLVTGKLPAVTVPLSPRFQQIRDRINALFGNRVESPPPLDLRYNPFRPAGAELPVAARDSTPGTEPVRPAPPSSDQVILEQAVAMLTFRGIIERGGRSQLQVALGVGTNSSGTYKEGDVLTVIVRDSPCHLRVRQVTRTSVMFSLNDAEFTMKF